MKQLILSAFILCSALAQAQAYSKFAPYEKKLFKKEEGSMRILIIDNVQDSFQLRKPSFPIDPGKQTKLLEKFTQRLWLTVTDSSHLGVGIAAPQVGVHKRIIWVQRFDREAYPWECYLNPKVLKCSGEKVAGLEGCLSIPNRTDTVFRQQDIFIEYDLLNGERKEEVVKGFTSVIVQHEIDHLNGILYLDHLRSED